MSIEASRRRAAIGPDDLASPALAALGVVFGDIGTSPLYTLKTVLDYTGPHPDPADDARRAVADRMDAVPHHDGQIRQYRHAHRQ